jgi:hypothetical protein
LFLPEPGRPACILLARLHPAGAQRIRKQRIRCSNKTHLVKNK